MTAAGEARAGLHAGILAAIQTLTHGMIGFAVLGAAGVAFGIAAGLAASALAGVAMAVSGASRPLIGTTTAATALLTGGLLAAAKPAGLGETVLLAMMLSGMAGLLMFGLARTGLARLAALMPTSVALGLSTAIALLVMISQLPLLLGGAPGAGLAAPQPGALAVAALALALMLRPLPGLPAPLVALAAASLLHHLLALADLAAGPAIGAAPDLPALAAGMGAAMTGPLPALRLELLLPAALSLALLATIETLSATTLLREASGRRCDQNRDLQGAALGMLGAASSGGMPVAGLGVPSMACWRAGGRGRGAQLWRAAVPAALLLAGGAIVAALPFAALAGVLCGAVARMIQMPASPLGPGAGRGRRLGDWLVALSVIAAALAFGLVAAVGLGTLLAVLIFTASMASSPVRRSTRNPVGRSRIRRAAMQERALREAGEAIALIELEGAIFFGSAERVVQQAEAEVAAGARVLILDLTRVMRLDLSGGRRLIEVCRILPGRVLLAPMNPASRVAGELAMLGLSGKLPPGCCHADLPAAVEAAEALVLAGDGMPHPAAADTPRAALEALGIAAHCVAPILARCVEAAFDRDQPILRRGEPADAAYLLLSGEVLISLPADGARPAIRLAVLAPGVIFGESALLGGRLRSADATARTEVRCMRLGAADAEALRQVAPAAAWELMAAVARQLSLHVSAANGIIDRLES